VTPDALPDLRTAVEGLRGFPTHGGDWLPDPTGHYVEAGRVLFLIPIGAVLVTEESLAAALNDAGAPFHDNVVVARAILARLRDTPA
jgi:hypothetical protein